MHTWLNTHMQISLEIRTYIAICEKVCVAESSDYICMYSRSDVRMQYSCALEAS